MPLHHLDITPTDVSSTGLGLALNAPPPPPLASCRLTHPDGGALILGVLGASHVITVEHREMVFSEEISCTARSHGNALPDRTEAAGYRIRTETVTHPEPAFRALAEELREHCRHDDGWLGGAFPGDDAALTALAAESDGTGWHWRTWHLYPTRPGGTVVHTRTWWRP